MIFERKIMMKEIQLRASGNSMSPTICSGDLLIIDTSAKNYSIDDIVLFYTKEGQEIKFTAHRIVHIFNNMIFITKGDNNLHEDRPIRVNRIIGKVMTIKK